MVLFGLVSTVLLLVGLTRFAFTEYVCCVAVPFVLLNGVYLLLSYAVMLSGRTFRLDQHQQLIEKWSDGRWDRSIAQVDVFLPVCGESRETVLETWAGVRDLQWPGRLTVYVLDDSPSDALQEDAHQHGFTYLRRSDRHLRKAGNLRHAFARSSGDFILLLDADFRPRPDMLQELLPYLLEDPQLAIVQSPQFFDVSSEMGWVEAGAGYVQELFYRLIQPARDRFGAAVCVGSCAVYRRSALEILDGAAPISHSEDLWTGFELLARGWRVKYVPIILAKGLCPDRLAAFFSQQYRWCLGSLSLVSTGRFWRSALTLPQKCCFAAGFAYYAATACNTLLTPLPPLIMVCFFPDWVHWSHLAFSVLALVYTPFIIGLWSVYPFGLHFLTTREASCAAHLKAVVDWSCGRMQDWIVTGTGRTVPHSARERWPLACLLAAAAVSFAAVGTCTAGALATAPQRWFHFVPPLLFTSLHAAVCWRMLPAWGTLCLLFPRLTKGKLPLMDTPRPFPKFVTRFACLGLVVLAPGLIALWNRPRATGPESPVAVSSLPKRTINAPPADIAPPPFNVSARADFAPYVVVNGFPGAPDIRQVMRMREHPRQPETYFLADYTGRIKEVTWRNSKWHVRTVVDLSSSELDWLYSFDIHPQFPSDPRLFLSYRTAKDARPLLFRVAAIPLRPGRIAGPRDVTTLIEQQVETDEHLAGDLAFDAAGCLLISVGDNEKSHHDQRSQRLDGGFFSGILRIDVDQRRDRSHAPPWIPPGAKTGEYLIPNDNPFVGSLRAAEEFWALGLRNPFRISFDHSSDRLWIGEVGQDRLEQIELAAPGTNHLWSFQEGTLPYANSYLQGRPPHRLWGTPVNPLYEYPHEDLDFCIIGGEVYTGEKFPELRGRYLFGDNRSGRIWSLDPLQPDQRELLVQLPFTKAASTLVSISTDRQGNIFFTNFTSLPAVYRLEPSEPIDFPDRLSETGFFRSLPDLEPVGSFIPYDVTAPLWSDGMQKQRWFQLPRGTQIDNSNPGTRWQLPAGTVLLKHFDSPSSPARKVETRILVVKADGTTAGASYVWNDQGDEAWLQLERRVVRLATKSGEMDYRIPSFRDCRVCHNRENPVLGITAQQLNRNSESEPSAVNQLLTLSAQGVFTAPYSRQELETLPALAALDDLTMPLELRARSYLHANCSFCHFPGGLEHVDFSLRLFGSGSQEQLVGAPARLHYHQVDGVQAKLLIAPGRPEESAIFRRLRTEDTKFAMPYLGRSTPDHAALDVVGQWIRSLATDPAPAPQPTVAQ